MHKRKSKMPTTKISLPLDYDLHDSQYLQVIDDLKTNGKIIEQSRSSPYNWRDNFCSYDEEDTYLMNRTGCTVSLKETIHYDSDARDGCVADARLIINGAKESIDTLVGEINILLKNASFEPRLKSQ